MQDLRWEDVSDWFNPHENGTLPDVLVSDASMASWEALLALIRSHGWRCEYEYQPHPLPESASELVATDPDGGRRTSRVWPYPHFERIVRPWSADEIVSDVSLHEIQGQERLDAFCGFLRTLGTALGRASLCTRRATTTTRP